MIFLFELWAWEMLNKRERKIGVYESDKNLICDLLGNFNMWKFKFF